MKTLKLVFTLLFGVFMILAGVNHFLKPDMYSPFIPDFLPKSLINDGAGIVEIVLGAGVFIPGWRHTTSLGILWLMLLFLPLHLIDVFRDKPAIGSHTVALIRLPLQLVLILWAWFISRQPKAAIVS